MQVVSWDEFSGTSQSIEKCFGNQSRIFLICHGDKDRMALRAAIIQAHMETCRPYFCVLGKMDQIRRPDLSKWGICKITISNLFSKKLIEVCYILTILLTASISTAIIIYSGGMGRFSLVMCAFEILIIWLISLISEDVRKEFKNAIHQIRKQMMVDVQTLELIPTSDVSIKDNIRDILSLEDLSAEEARRPNMLTIGPYTSNIFSMIKATLAKPRPEQNRLPHPMENRAMTQREQELFLQDIALFLATDTSSITSLWKIDSHDLSRLNRYLDSGIVDHFRNSPECNELARYQKLLDSLPPIITEKYCQEFHLSINEQSDHLKSLFSQFNIQAYQIAVLQRLINNMMREP